MSIIKTGTTWIRQTAIAMIKLYQFKRTFGLPNMSPFCMKVETWLRMAGLEYETVLVP